MSKQFDELAKDLAKGMSRRSAIRVFLTGIGTAVTGILLGRGTAQAAPPDHKGHKDRDKHEDMCRDHCEKLYGSKSELFEECCEESEECGKDSCAANYAVNATNTVGKDAWTCMPAIVKM